MKVNLRLNHPVGCLANPAWLMLVVALFSSILLTGCATAPLGSGEPDPFEYNAETGYPAVGGEDWLL